MHEIFRWVFALLLYKRQWWVNKSTRRTQNKGVSGLAWRTLPDKYKEKACSNQVDSLGVAKLDPWSIVYTPSRKISNQQHMQTLMISQATTRVAKVLQRKQQSETTAWWWYCPHSSKEHKTSAGDYSDCFHLKQNQKKQAIDLKSGGSPWKKSKHLWNTRNSRINSLRPSKRWLNRLLTARRSPEYKSDWC